MTGIHPETPMGEPLPSVTTGPTSVWVGPPAWAGSLTASAPVTGYGPAADAIRAEVDADDAKDKLIAQLRAEIKIDRAEYARLQEEAEQTELERNDARQQLRMARDKLDKALAANERWAQTLGDVHLRHTEVKRERDAHKLRADHYEDLWRVQVGMPPDEPPVRPTADGGHAIMLRDEIRRAGLEQP